MVCRSIRIMSVLMSLFAVTVYSGQDVFDITEDERTESAAASTRHQETGSLHIEVNPPNAVVYVDGQQVGMGTILVKNLTPGPHQVFVVSEDGKEEKTAYVIAGKVQTVEISTGRKLYFEVTSSYSQMWSRKVRAFGPSLDIGLRHKQNYYGINYNWNIFDEWGSYESGEESGFMLGGAAFQYLRNVFTVGEMLEIGAGFSSGFWYFSGDIPSPSNSDYSGFSSGSYDYFEELFFGGPSARVCVGHKIVFASATITMLVGTRFSPLLTAGVTMRM